MDLSEFYAAEFGHSCDDVNCRYLFADEELSDLRREQCLVSDCRFDSSDPISSCEPLPTDSGDPFNMVGLNYKDKGRILARKESDKKLEVEGTKFPEELAEPDSFVRPNIVLDCTDQDEAAEFTPDFFNYENMNGDGFESEGLTLRNEKNVAALWTAVKTWLNEDQRDKVKFIAANKLPKSIPLRHQLNSLDGEKIWSYSCAKLNREENLSLEELPHYDVRVTTIASELKASYSRDKIQGQDDDNVAAKQSNATSFFTTVNDIRKAFAADDEALTLDEEELSTIPSLSSYRSADYQDRSYFGSCKTSSVDGKDSYIEKECCALVVYADKKCAPIFLNLEMGENRGVDCPGEAQSLNKEEAIAKMDRDFQPEPFNNKSPLVADKDNDSPQKAAEDQPSTASISGKFPSPGCESDEKDESTSVGGLINISPSNVVKFMPQQVNSAAKIWGGGGSDDVMVAHLRISTPAHHKSVVTFKIKSNKPDRYFVKPSVGVLRPGKMFDVRILLSSGCDPLREQLSHDRFLVLACKLDDSYYRRQHFAADDTKLIRRLWKKLERGGEYVQHRLRVIQPETTVTVATGDSSSLAHGQQHQMTRGGESGDERKVRREVKRLRVRLKMMENQWRRILRDALVWQFVLMSLALALVYRLTATQLARHCPQLMTAEMDDRDEEKEAVGNWFDDGDGVTAEVSSLYSSVAQLRGDDENKFVLEEAVPSRDNSYYVQDVTHLS